MFKLLLIASVVICDLYLFHIISLLNPDFKLVNNLISSSLDKVTTGTYNLQSVILTVAPVGALSLLPPPMSLCSKLVITQFLSHFNSINTSQLINGIVCSYHVTYAFQSESTLYSCLNVKELLTRSRCEI